MNKENIKADVVVGEGKGLYYKEIEVDFSNIRTSSGVFSIENISNRIEGKEFYFNGKAIIFTVYIYIDITYKTNNYVYLDIDGSLTSIGKFRYISKIIEYSGCLEPINLKVDTLLPSDKIEVTDIRIIGIKEELLEPTEFLQTATLKLDTEKDEVYKRPLLQPIYQYKKIKIKIGFKINLSIVREEYIEVNTD